MRARVTALWAGAVLMSAGPALAGCSSDQPAPPGPSGSAAGSSGGGTSAPPAAVAAYSGPALPGLATKPTWSMPYAGFPLQAVPVGEAVAVAQPAADYKGSSTPAATTPKTETGLSPERVIEFRDIATGAVRGAVRTPMATLTADTWDGKPVAVVSFRSRTKPDGLTEAQTVRHIVGYDAAGSMVKDLTAAGEDNALAVVDGRLLRSGPPPDGGRSATVTLEPVLGGPSATTRCDLPVCGIVLDGSTGATVSAPPAQFKALVGPLAFTLAATRSGTGREVVAVDAGTGRRLWTTSAATAPRGAATDAELSYPRARPTAMVGDRLLMSWVAPGFSGAVLALHEPTTGKLLATGPTLPAVASRVYADPGGGYVVVTSDLSASEYGTAVWSLADGKVLWTQVHGDGQKGLAAAGLVNGVVYGHVAESGAISTGSDAEFIAVDAATRKILGDGLALGMAPLAGAGGHAVLLRDGTLFGFGPP